MESLLEQGTQLYQQGSTLTGKNLLPHEQILFFTVDQSLSRCSYGIFE